MSKIKILTVSIPEEEKNTVLSHYEKMGFEVINDVLVTRKNEYGTVINTFYKYHFKFDFGQKNADKLWAKYKIYKKKCAELDIRRTESVGGIYMSPKFIVVVTCVVGAILVPFFPMLLGNGFGDFTQTNGFLFDLKRSFDTVTFISAIFVGLSLGLAVSITIEAIKAAVTRNKRMLLAIDRIPVLENEINELVEQNVG